MKYLGICILFFLATSITYIVGVGHGRHHMQPNCGVPVYREFGGMVEHVVFRDSVGKTVGYSDIVFREGLTNTLHSSFRFGDDAYSIRLFYPDTVCLEEP